MWAISKNHLGELEKVLAQDKDRSIYVSTVILWCILNVLLMSVFPSNVFLRNVFLMDVFLRRHKGGAGTRAMQPLLRLDSAKSELPSLDHGERGEPQDCMMMSPSKMLTMMETEMVVMTTEMVTTVMEMGQG